MHTRFGTSLLLTIAGAFLVVVSLVFGLGAVEWLAFGIGIGTVVIAGASLATGRAIEHTLDLALVALGAWTIVASLVFSGTTLLWLSFAEGAGIAGLSLANHLLGELRIGSRLHEVEDAGTRPSPYRVAA